MCTWGLGPDLWIRMSLTHFADLTDVTLADVDINSILLKGSSTKKFSIA